MEHFCYPDTITAKLRLPRSDKISRKIRPPYKKIPNEKISQGKILPF